MADAAVQEELIHAAWIHGLHQLGQQQGTGRATDFQAFKDAQTQQILSELDSSLAGQQAFLNAANVYANPRSRSRGKFRSYQEARKAYQGQESYLFAELGRQLIQLRKQDDMTESAFRRAMGYLQKWFKTALDGLRKVAADPAAISPALNEAILATEGVLNGLGQGGRMALPPTQFQHASPLTGSDGSSNPHSQDTANESNNDGAFNQEEATRPKHLFGTTQDSVDHKLANYSLKPDHPVGGPKSVWFKKALGFDVENAHEFAAQIKFDEATAFPTQLTEFGLKYNQIIPIRGANGKVIPVEFAWICNLDGVIRLTTIIPGGVKQ